MIWLAVLANALTSPVQNDVRVSPKPAIVAGELSEEQGLKRDFVRPQDYPSRSIRDGIQGLVTTSILVAPDGSIIEVTPIGNADPILTAVVAEMAKRRLRNLHFKGHQGRYVRIRLPSVQFRLKPCREGMELAPPVPRAIVVTFECKIVEF